MNPAFRRGFLRCIRPLPLRLTLIDVRRPGEIMEDLRGFVLDKLTTIEMDMDAATSGTCERLQNGPVGPHKAAMLMPCRAPSMITTSIVLAILFVTGAVPRFGGGGKPHRIITLRLGQRGQLAP